MKHTVALSVSWEFVFQISCYFLSIFVIFVLFYNLFYIIGLWWLYFCLSKIKNKTIVSKQECYWNTISELFPPFLCYYWNTISELFPPFLCYRIAILDWFIMKTNIRYWWSSIPPISTKWKINWPTTTKKITTNDVGNRGLVQTQKCGWIKPELTDHKKEDHDIWCWISQLGTDTKMWRH